MLVAMLIMNASPLFNPLFDAIGMATGTRTVIIQLLAVAIAGAVVGIRRWPPVFKREMMQVILLWLPFVVYIAIRTDFNDNYAMVKFWKIVLIPILSAVTITAMYLVGGEKFNKYFIVTLIVMSLLQLLEALNNPAVFLYAGEIERMTVEGVNPIWLARSFVTAAILCLVLPFIKSKVVRGAAVVGLMLAVLPTGSRGPLFAGALGIALFFWQYYKNKPNFKIKVIAASMVLLVGMFASLPYIYAPLKSYISRDSSEDAFQESGRSALFSRAWREYADSPILGQGMGNFATMNATRVTLANRTTGNYPHNIILEVMSELGTIGLILFVVGMRPGKYYWKVDNIYQILFIVSLVFAMTSGNIAANGGVMVFGVLARLAYKYKLSGLMIDEKTFRQNKQRRHRTQ